MYRPLRSATIDGDEIYVYAEVGNHALRHIRSFATTHLTTFAPYREAFVTIAVRARGIPPGEYKMRVTIEDRIGGKTASGELPFTVAAPRPAK